MVEFFVEMFYTAIRAGTTLLIATLGEIITERSGVLNLGMEGMMIVGAIVGFGATMITGNPWAGILVAALAGMLMALVHAFASVHRKKNQILVGISLTIFGLGLSSLLGKPYTGIPLRNSPEPLPIPLLSEIPFFGQVFFNHNLLVYFSLVAAFALWLLLNKTKFGIITKSVGENAAACDSMGINVFRVRYACTVFGGAMAGIAGGYLSIAFVPAWIEGMTAGRGWLVIALTTSAIWNPLIAILVAYLFGVIETLQFSLQIYNISPQILAMTPYAAAIVALIVATNKRFMKRIGAPAELAKPFERGEK